MLHCKPLQVLCLVGACLSVWAAPLGSLTEEKCCESKDTTDHLASRDKMCTMFSLQVPLCPRVINPDRTRHEVAVTDPVIGHVRQVKLVQRSVKAYTQYQSTDELRSADEKMNENPITVTPSESVTLVDHTVGYENTEQKDASHMLGPFQLSSNRPAQTEVTLGHSKYVSLRYSDVEEGTRTEQLPSPEEDRGRKVLTIKKNRSAEVDSERERGISTESLFMIPSSTHDSISQSPWTVSLAFTALTASGSHDGQAGRATVDKKRIAEENPNTDTEVQDKALVSGLLQPDLTLNSRLAELSGAWAETVQLQGETVEEASELPLSQEVGTEAIMSSEHLPLIFEPTDDVTPSSSSMLAPELSFSMMPTTGMLEEAELEQTVSMDTDHTPHVSLSGPSDWPSPWHMSGAETFDAVVPSRKPVARPLSEADQERLGRTERLQNTAVIPTSVGSVGLSALPDAATTQNVLQNKSAHPAMLKPISGLEELESEENEDEDDEDMDESEEDDEEEDASKEETETHEHSPTRPPYSLIPPPVWGQRNQGLVRSWVELIREKAGYVSGMLAPVGIGIAGALFIVGALYGIRMIHRKRKNNLKHQRRKQPTEVRQGPDHAMLLADSSEDEL